MATIIIGDTGTQHPMDYLYQRDLEHPSTKRCHCGRYLHVVGSTSSLPIRWYYRPKCVYHDDWSSKVQYSSMGKKYLYDVKTGGIQCLGSYSPLLNNGW